MLVPGACLCLGHPARRLGRASRPPSSRKASSCGVAAAGSGACPWRRTRALPALPCASGACTAGPSPAPTAHPHPPSPRSRACTTLTGGVCAAPVPRRPPRGVCLHPGRPPLHLHAAAQVGKTSGRFASCCTSGHCGRSSCARAGPSSGGVRGATDARGSALPCPKPGADRPALPGAARPPPPPPRRADLTPAPLPACANVPPPQAAAQGLPCRAGQRCAAPRPAHLRGAPAHGGCRPVRHAAGHQRALERMCRLTLTKTVD